LPAPCTTSRRPTASANKASSPAHEQTPVLCARVRIPPLPCTRDSSQSGPSRPLQQCAVPEIPSPVSKCYRRPFALQSEAKSRIRCLLPNTKLAAFSHKRRSATPKTPLRSSHHLLPKHKQSLRSRAAPNLPAALSSLASAPSDAP